MPWGKYPPPFPGSLCSLNAWWAHQLFCCLLPACLPARLFVHSCFRTCGERGREREGRQEGTFIIGWGGGGRGREGSAAIIIIIPANELNIIIREKKYTFRARASNGPVLPVMVLEQEICLEALSNLVPYTVVPYTVM